MAKPRSNSGIAAVSEITRTINKIMEPQYSFYAEEKLPLGPYLPHASFSTVFEIPFSRRKFGILGINIIELKKTVEFSIVPKVLDFSVVSDSKQTITKKDRWTTKSRVSHVVLVLSRNEQQITANILH